MALSMTCIVARKSMVTILSRQLLSVGEFADNLDELVYI